jgi:hypothetical protein
MCVYGEKKGRKNSFLMCVLCVSRVFFSTLSANKSRVPRVVNPTCRRHIIHIVDTRTSCYDRHQKTVNAKLGPPRKFHAVFPLIQEAPQLFLLLTHHQKPFPRYSRLALFHSHSLFHRMRLSAYYYTVLLQHAPTTLEQTGLTIYCIFRFIFSIRDISYKTHDCFVETVYSAASAGDLRLDAVY